VWNSWLATVGGNYAYRRAHLWSIRGREWHERLQRT
jgi:hypothetical protein